MPYSGRVEHHPKFKFIAIKFINYVQNHIKRGATSRVYDLLGLDCAVIFYPFWCRVTAVAPRHKQGDLGTGKSYRLVGYSSRHKGGYELWNEETKRSVVRGDVHHLRFFPSDLNTQSTTHNQPQTDSTSDDTTIVIDNDDDSFVDGFVYQPTGQKVDVNQSPRSTARTSPCAWKNSQLVCSSSPFQGRLACALAQLL